MEGLLPRLRVARIVTVRRKDAKSSRGGVLERTPSPRRPRAPRSVREHDGVGVRLVRPRMSPRVDG